jgi:hypothetical protein
MQVSAAGLLKWTVPEETKDIATDVIVTVRDASGQEVFHTFPLKLVAK